MSGGPSVGSGAGIDSARWMAAATSIPAGLAAASELAVGAAASTGSPAGGVAAGGTTWRWVSNSTPAPDISWTTDRLRTGASPETAAGAARSMPRAASISAAEGPVTSGVVSRLRCSIAAWRCAIRANQLSLPNWMGPAGACGSTAASGA
ncbi:MAG: hypothetical protein IT301_11560 [Dehalococcoidia bacterium]|nr:hypothetical protein [Dehalococcoidia bacterium]